MIYTIELSFYTEFKRICALHEVDPAFALDMYMQDFITLDATAT